MPAPRLVVGLGNPGAEYENTRHNVGFWFVDRLAAQLKTPLAPQAKFFGRAARAGELWLLQPTTFMNRSGQAVAALANFYKIPADEILVVHDELDLVPGAIRLKQGGGNGGHNGLKDLQARLGTADFWRLRLGIGHPRTLNLAQQVVDFVLHPPRKEELPAIEQALERSLLAWPRLAAGDFAGAQQQLHGKAA
ncbi:MAG: aminoacyl-tRNA hydrolase [Azonexus sp.]|jgi:PTH1 family peptidyl-tRNA hydrolase|uniref:aminoacyl-tRNA hydrolase n=1 Tax=Azonexus sp. TaxID=1872668 RepID=UPI00281A712D|nr:aminoacyl-tRNA hydrolase [Azonexus sp.]MDR0776688.1 aminoacyl-tRNA hydrolase [Azonexus sp.]